mmetsp:Transcript_16760/g.25188  ORF Transcript_16760/g.25188 Transcript_16760/m.25188 type:complete len:231 (-) Transcript_16760:215-907(-)|eukprot:CAMPEP_0197287786 /NCGR_PEP_ID=MMETSP0890-20130614/4510_1 /TAXON_ID=44058 ORGANISM="Aureoumbra lagunensis, Strain CCMP1510" /NCGR_SAMPLE_ID=MMETSP0890 /ASSEMBLY_ACC=CAM_ASM_000533 /LENGTH=230 /DNA_ID=CAMNT_0042757891 /DNA_START=62 /DNA_END=754 /DNA_ORIENTATION=-
MLVRSVLIGLGYFGGVCGLEAPAVVWSGVEAKYLSPHYEMKSYEPSIIGSILESADAAVKLLVVVPETAGIFENLGESGRRLSAKASVLPFVKAPSSATEFAPSAEYTTFDDQLHRQLDNRPNGGFIVAVGSSDAIDLDQISSLAENWAQAIGRPQSYIAAVAVTSLPTRRLDDATTITYDGVRMTPDIMSGVLVMILFLFTAILGLSCIGAIQTPSQFAKQGPPSLKEW